MSDSESTSNPLRLFAGLALLLVGIVLALDRLDIIDRHALPPLESFWPLVLVVVGVRAWINTEGIVRWIGVLFALSGLLALARTLNFVDIIPGAATLLDSGVLTWANIFPVALIAGGLFFVLGGRLNTSGDTLDSHHRVGQFTMFGGAELRPNTSDFRGGWLAAMFGGCELDLRGCSSTEPVTRLDVMCLFGGCEVRVPEHWNVELSGIPLFGGFGSDTKCPDPSEVTHVLKIQCVAMFGGMSVEN